MSEEFGTDPDDVIAQLSPCVRPPYYEVDFAAEIVKQLEQSGVRRVFDSGENTASDLNKFYSYRMEKGRTGRMLALLALK
jgi:copper oxidase (laccase) domain-containing protein